MKSNPKAWLFGLCIAAVIAGGLYYFLREEPLTDTRQEAVTTRMAFSGSKLTEDQDGKRIWELTARVMEVDPKTRWVYLTDLDGVLFRADGTHITVTAKNAVVDPQTRDSARHICRRRFIGTYTEPPRPEPVPPGTLRLVRLAREGALSPGDRVATQRLGECEVTRIHTPHSIEVRDPSTGRHYLISGLDFGTDARVVEVEAARGATAP